MSVPKRHGELEFQKGTCQPAEKPTKIGSLIKRVAPPSGVPAPDCMEVGAPSV
jgi:hypothetical protein